MANQGKIRPYTMRPYSPNLDAGTNEFLDWVRTSLNSLAGLSIQPGEGISYLSNAAVDPTTPQIVSLGSRPQSAATVMTYVSDGAGNITFHWDGTNGSQPLQIYRDDGTITPAITGSLKVTGLRLNTTYYFYPYYDEATGRVLWPSIKGASTGSPSVAFPSQNIAALQQQIMRNRVPLGYLLSLSGASTAAGSASAGGGGGGGNGNRVPGAESALTNVQLAMPSQYVVGSSIVGRVEDINVGWQSEKVNTFLAAPTTDLQQLGFDKGTSTLDPAPGGGHISTSPLTPNEDTGVALAFYTEQSNSVILSPSTWIDFGNHNGWYQFFTSNNPITAEVISTNGNSAGILSVVLFNAIQPVLLQNAIASGFVANPSTGSVTTPKIVTKGSTLVVAVQVNGATSIPTISVTDSIGNVFTQVYSFNDNAATINSIFAVVNTGEIADKVTVNFSGTTSATFVLQVFEFTGISPLPLIPTFRTIATSDLQLAPATAAEIGAIQLSGDLAGTAPLPTVVSTHLTSPLPLAQGGTAANLNATGGSSQYVKQSSVGAALTVGTIPVADVVGAASQIGVQDESYTYAADTGTANTYAVALSPVPSGYVAGMVVQTKIANSNTGASTLNVNSLGAKNINKLNGTTALVSGDLIAGQVVSLIYDGTNFQLQNPVADTVTSVFGRTGAVVTATGDYTLDQVNDGPTLYLRSTLQQFAEAVENGDFGLGSGTNIPGWFGNGATISIDTTKSPPFGTNALKVAASIRFGSALSSFNAFVVPGEIYKISGYVLSDGTSLPDIQLEILTETGSYITGAQYSPGPVATWTFGSALITVPSNGVLGQISLQNNAVSGAGICWFKGIRVQKVRVLDDEVNDGILRFAVGKITAPPGDSPAVGTIRADTTNNKIWVFTSTGWKGVAIA